MVTKSIELSTSSNQTTCAAHRRLEETHRRVILRRGGRDVAMLSPLVLEISREAPPRREITDKDRAASRAAAGSWAGNVDFEAWERARAESRSLPPKPPVDLGDFGKPE